MATIITTQDILATLAIESDEDKAAAVKAQIATLRTQVKSARRAEDKAKRQTGKSGALAYHLFAQGVTTYASKGAMADDFKVSPSLITKWKNLALALFVKGIDEDSDLFMRDLNGSTLCNKKEVSALLADDTTDAAGIEAEVRKYVDADGVEVKADNGGPGTRKTTKAVCLALVETLTTKAKTLKYDEFETVEAAMHKAITDIEAHFVAEAAKAEAEELAKQAEAS